MPIYNIGGIRTAMSPQYPKLRRKAELYLSNDTEADVCINLSPLYWEEQKARQAHLTEETLEYILMGMAFYRQAVSHGGVLLHASAVAKDGRAYLFSAPSGTGKSTHTLLWKKTLSGVSYINDDKPLLRQKDGQFFCCGTPFSGKTDLHKNIAVPCGAICALERGETTRVERLLPTEAAYYILNQTLRSVQNGEDLLALIGALVETVPCYRVYTTMEDSAAETVWREIAYKEE